MKYWLD